MKHLFKAASMPLALTLLIALSNPAVANTTENQRFVYWLHQDLLGRAPSPSALVLLTAMLDNNLSTRTQVAAMITNGHEYHTRLVNIIYKAYLNRNPNQAELANGLVNLAVYSSQQFRATILPGAAWAYLNPGYNGPGLGFPQVIGEMMSVAAYANPTLEDKAAQTFKNSSSNGYYYAALVILLSKDGAWRLLRDSSGLLKHMNYPDLDAAPFSLYVLQLMSGKTEESVYASLGGGTGLFRFREVQANPVNFGDVFD